MNDPRPDVRPTYGFSARPFDAQAGAGGAVLEAGSDPRRVLRNTYWLLALSLVPTVLGAWAGLATGIAFSGLGIIILFLMELGLIFGIQRFKNSGTGVTLLMAFTFVMGLMLSVSLFYALRFANGPLIVAEAFGGTALIFFSMATIATVSKRDFSAMGQWLFVGLIVVIVASIANMFLHLPALQLALSVMSILIFSGFMVFDVQRIVRGGETNYITATLAIYLDLINVFQQLLYILSIFTGSNRN